MSEMKRLQEYLFDEGVLDKSAEEILRAKETHKKTRKRNYQREFLKKYTRVEIFLTEEEKNLFEKMAKKSGLSKGKFILLTAKNYLNQQFLLYDKEIIRCLKQLILICRGCGNNVNQIARYVNTVKPHSFHPDGLYFQLKRMEDHIRQYLCEPENILEYIKRKITEFPQLINEIKKNINNR